MNLISGTKGSDILVAYADSHTAVRKSIILFLESLGGIKVIAQACNGKELIEQIDISELKPDICILDIKMPVMNGFETVAILKQKWQQIKTLIFTGFEEDMYVLRMIKIGINGYLHKGCEPQEIKQALVSINDTEVYYSELFSRKIVKSLQRSETSVPNFTEKEMVFLKFCATDMTYAEIAKAMKCTPKSVEGYRDSLFRKLKVNSRVSLTVFAMQSGIIPLESCPIH